MSTIKTTHRFQNITQWSHELNRWAQGFKHQFGVYPNILLASSETYNRIDLIANTTSKRKIRNPEGKTSGKFIKMSGFKGQHYELAFCVDERLPTDEVRLILDVDPGPDGEEFDKEDVA